MGMDPTPNVDVEARVVWYFSLAFAVFVLLVIIVCIFKWTRSQNVTT